MARVCRFRADDLRCESINNFFDNIGDERQVRHRSGFFSTYGSRDDLFRRGRTCARFSSAGMQYVSNDLFTMAVIIGANY